MALTNNNNFDLLVIISSLNNILASDLKCSSNSKNNLEHSSNLKDHLEYGIDFLLSYANIHLEASLGLVFTQSAWVELNNLLPNCSELAQKIQTWPWYGLEKIYYQQKTTGPITSLLPDTIDYIAIDLNWLGQACYLSKRTIIF